MIAMLTICWKIFALLSRVSYFLGLLAQLGLYKECPLWSSSSLPQLFMNFVPCCSHPMAWAIVLAISYTSIPKTLPAKYPPMTSFRYTFIVLQNSWISSGTTNLGSLKKWWMPHIMRLALMTYPTFFKESILKKCSIWTLGSLSFKQTFTTRMDTGASLTICKASPGKPSSNEVDGGLFLKLGSAWVAWVWFCFLDIARVSRSFQKEEKFWVQRGFCV